MEARFRPGSTRGSATVEFALVLPMLVLVCLAFVQVGVLVRDQLVVVGAARAAAREAAVESQESTIWDAMVAAASVIPPDALSMKVDRGGGRGEPVTVEVRYTARFGVPFVGWLFPHTVAIVGRATMRQEFG